MDPTKLTYDQLKSELNKRELNTSDPYLTLQDTLKRVLQYEQLKMPQLKAELKNRGLLVTGKKAQLVKRLVDSDYEVYVENMDPVYYDTIKSVIPSSALHCLPPPGIDENPWKTLWDELNRICGKFDKDFVYLVRDYDNKLVSEDEKVQLTKIKDFASSDAGYEYVLHFFESYPLYSYILLKTTRLMKLYAMEFRRDSPSKIAACIASYLTEDDIKELVVSSRIDLMEHLRSYDLIRELDTKYPDSFNLRRFPAYIARTAPIILLKYMLDKGLPVTDSLIYIVGASLNWDKIRLFLDSVESANLVPLMIRLLTYGRYDILAELFIRYKRLIGVYDITQLLPTVCRLNIAPADKLKLVDYLLATIRNNQYKIRKEDINRIIDEKRCDVLLRDKLFRAEYDQA
jgi:hypothetical protein